MCKRLSVLLLAVLSAPVLSAARLPRLVMPHHYVLTVTPDLQNETFAGQETIFVTVQRPTKTIVLNAAEITFRDVEVVGGGAKQTARVTLDEKQEQVTLSLAEPLPVGPAEIH